MAHPESIATLKARNASMEFHSRRLVADIEHYDLEKKVIWKKRLAQAIAWLQSEHGDKTRGLTPEVRMLNGPYAGSLGVFENFGKRGDAVLLTDQDFGKVWWLKLSFSDNLQFHVLGLTNGESGGLECELHYG